MLRVEISELGNSSSTKVFFCDKVKVCSAVPNRFVVLHNKRAKVPTSQIFLKPSEFVSID